MSPFPSALEMTNATFNLKEKCMSSMFCYSWPQKQH